MRTVVQRVSTASVRWDGGAASIGPGYCLLVGVADTDQERDAVAEKLHEFTGLSTDFIKKAKLRIRESLFTQELLREHIARTGSMVARNVLASWDRGTRERFVRVIAREYREALARSTAPADVVEA